SCQSALSTIAPISCAGIRCHQPLCTRDAMVCMRGSGAVVCPCGVGSASGPVAGFVIRGTRHSLLRGANTTITRSGVSPFPAEHLMAHHPFAVHQTEEIQMQSEVKTAASEPVKQPSRRKFLTTATVGAAGAAITGFPMV